MMGWKTILFLWDGTFSGAMLIFQGGKLLVKRGRCLEEIAVRFCGARTLYYEVSLIRIWETNGNDIIQNETD